MWILFWEKVHDSPLKFHYQDEVVLRYERIVAVQSEQIGAGGVVENE